LLLEGLKDCEIRNLIIPKQPQNQKKNNAQSL